MLYFLMCGYGKDVYWYNKIYKKINKIADVQSCCIFVDNKHGFVIKNKDVCFVDVNTNEWFEFSGYIYLIHAIMKDIKECDKVILVNDTIYLNHFGDLWLEIIIKNINENDNDVIYGDGRFSGKDFYLSSWIYILNGKLLIVFNRILKDVTCCAKRNKAYYEAVNIELYARHLDYEKRKRLIDWLFNESLYKGWTKSCSFEKMNYMERYRKGLSIYMEHKISDILLSSSIDLIDIKIKYPIAKLINYMDRVISFFQRILSKLYG